MDSRPTTTPGTRSAVNPETRPLPGRRNILGDAIAGLAGAVILAGAGVAMATPETLASEPDAELVALCERHRQIISRQHGLQHSVDDNAFDDIVAEGTSTLDEMTPIRARTSLGIRAKALALAADDPSMFEGSIFADIDMDLAASLIADLLGFEVGDAAAISRLQAGNFTLSRDPGAFQEGAA